MHSIFLIHIAIIIIFLVIQIKIIYNTHNISFVQEQYNIYNIYRKLHSLLSDCHDPSLYPGHDKHGIRGQYFRMVLG